LKEYVERLKRELNPYLIILFGSFAKNDFNEGSDIDLVVVADFEEKFLDRIKLLMDLNEFYLPLEPIGYTKDEFERMREKGNSFILEVLATGKIIYKRV
jgi:hypothetical protein